MRSAINNLLSKQSLQWFIMVSGLFLTATAFQKQLFLNKFGWLFLALLFAINTDYAVYAAFFYAAFFHGTGFFPNLFFTVKHFHIVVSLLVFILFLRSELWPKVKANYKSAYNLLIPWILIILISTIAAFLNDGDQMFRAFRTNTNILTLLVSSFLFICTMDRKQLIVNALLFFSFGVAVRIFFASFSSATGAEFFYHEYIFFNNHIGFLSASAIFILFALTLTSKPKLKASHYVISGLLLLMIFTGLLLSCSRTGWFAFLVGSAVFTYFFSRMRKSQYTREAMVSRLVLLGVTSLLALIVVMGISWNQDLFSRITSLKRFLDMDYLQFTLHETKNFGPFGIFRLNQFYSLQEILMNNWLVGVGFIKKVTDFHSLYLTLLGGSGVLGLGLFLIFALRWSSLLLDNLSKLDDGTNLIRLGVFSTFIVWLIYSLMETFVVQFNIWIVLAVGTILCDKRRVIEKLRNVQ